MTEPAEPDLSGPGRWVPWAILAGVLFAGGWLVLHLYTTPGARECGRLYRNAHTAADSARVDRTVPAERDGAGVQTHSCGYLRSNGQWR